MLSQPGTRHVPRIWHVCAWCCITDNMYSHRVHCLAWCVSRWFNSVFTCWTRYMRINSCNYNKFDIKWTHLLLFLTRKYTIICVKWWIHSLPWKYEHLHINQIQLPFLHFNQHSITLLGIHTRHSACGREKYTFITANIKVINTILKVNRDNRQTLKCKHYSLTFVRH